MSKFDWSKKATLGVSTKIRNDFSDYDYISKLSKAELSFLKGFNREYYNADFKHKNKKHYKKTKKHKSKRKICYDLNNCRNRDLYAIMKSIDRLETIDSGRDIPNLFFSDNTEHRLFLYNSKGEEIE